MKLIYESKTFWANIISIIGIVAGAKFGFNITPEMAVSILAVINIILRAVTNEEIVW